MKIWDRIVRWWYFHLSNPVVREGEKGGFKWNFRRFWLEISTVSGNFKARFMAAEHPYGYLIAGKDDRNIEGYMQTIYTVAMLLTTDQGFVDDVNKAIQKYQKRLEKASEASEDETEETIAIEGERELQEYIDLPQKQRKKVAKDIDRRFKQAVKKAESE